MAVTFYNAKGTAVPFPITADYVLYFIALNTNTVQHLLRTSSHRDNTLTLTRLNV